jgi:hypothetical protein
VLVVLGCGNRAWPAATAAPSTDVVFIAFGDTHYGDDGRAGETRSNLQIKAIDAIERFTWPRRFALAGRPIAGIRGVLMLGDVTDNGEAGQLKKFESDFGLNGERLLKYPVLEGFGNHDFTGDEAGETAHGFDGAYPVVQAIQRRNGQRRTPLDSVAKQGAHYSWTWGPVHFVNLDLKASDQPQLIEKDGRPHRWTQPYGALSFLKQDLAQHAGAGQPVVILQHYPFHSGDRMSEAELRQLRAALRPFNVIALLHAHTHHTQTYRWCGIPVFDVGSPHYDKKKNHGMGHFSLFRIGDGRLEAMSVGWRPAAPEQLVLPEAWHLELDLKAGAAGDRLRGQGQRHRDECPSPEQEFDADR